MTIPDKESLIKNLKLMEDKLNRIIAHIYELKKQRYINVLENLKYQSPKNKILQHLQTVDDLRSRLTLNMKHILKMNENLLIKYIEKINTLNPREVLKRGYSICLKMPERIVVKNIKQVDQDNLIEVMVRDGSISANVLGKEEIKSDW
jgi:exodeoxyribonuclease VII large subunit